MIHATKETEGNVDSHNNNGNKLIHAVVLLDVGMRTRMKMLTVLLLCCRRCSCSCCFSLLFDVCRYVLQPVLSDCDACGGQDRNRVHTVCFPFDQPTILFFGLPVVVVITDDLFSVVQFQEKMACGDVAIN